MKKAIIFELLVGLCVVLCAFMPKGYFSELIKPANLPNLLLVAVGIGAIVLAWQTVLATRDAAKAALKQAEHMVASERAWILVEIGEPEPKHYPGQPEAIWIRPVIKNVGRTIAKITKIRAIVRLNREGEPLPEVPEYPAGQGFDSNRFNRNGLSFVLPPNAPIQPFKLLISEQEIEQVRKHKLFLYVHGFVNYLDFRSEERQSSFCYFYAIQGVFDPDPTRFYLELTAPLAYNECI